MGSVHRLDDEFLSFLLPQTYIAKEAFNESARSSPAAS